MVVGVNYLASSNFSKLPQEEWKRSCVFDVKFFHFYPQTIACLAIVLYLCGRTIAAIGLKYTILYEA